MKRKESNNILNYQKIILLIIVIILLMPLKIAALEKYKIILDANGGIYENEEIIYAVDSLEIEKLKYPQKEGYEFIGYYEENGIPLEKYLEETIIDKDVIFYARWAPLEEIKKANTKKIIVMLLALISALGFFYIVLFCKEEE